MRILLQLLKDYLGMGINYDEVVALIVGVF